MTERRDADDDAAADGVPALDLVWSTGEFRSPQVEIDFRLDQVRHNLSTYSRVALIIAAVFVGFSVLDIVSLGLTQASATLIAARATAAMTVMWARWRLLRDPDHTLVLPHSATVPVAEAAVFATVLLVAVLRPDDAATTAISIAVLVLGATVVMPTRFWTQVMTGGAALAAFFALSFWAEPRLLSPLPLATNLVVTMGWGALIRRIFNIDARRRWQANAAAQRSARRLEQELLTADRLRDELQALARQDPLTGTANRRELLRRASAAHAGERGASMLLLDIDRFKSVNDRYGHAAGDSALIAVADTILSLVRHQDTVARVGGEEFAVLLDGADPDRAAALADRLCTTIATTVIPGLEGHRVTASIGIATAVHAESVERLMSRADDAMYRAKRDGGNRYATAAPLDRPADLPLGDQSPGTLLDVIEGSDVTHIT